MKKGEIFGMKQGGIGKTGEKYIFYDKYRRLSKYAVYVVVEGKQKFVGSYKTLDDAIISRDKYIDNL